MIFDKFITMDDRKDKLHDVEQGNVEDIGYQVSLKSCQFRLNKFCLKCVVSLVRYECLCLEESSIKDPST